MFKFLKGVVGGSGTGIKDLPYNIGEPYHSSWGSWTHSRGTSKVPLSSIAILIFDLVDLYSSNFYLEYHLPVPAVYFPSLSNWEQFGYDLRVVGMVKLIDQLFSGITCYIISSFFPLGLALWVNLMELIIVLIRRVFFLFSVSVVLPLLKLYINVQI